MIDEETLTAATIKAEELGLNVFNIFQLDVDEEAHCRKLIEIMSVEGRKRVLDVGSGIGYFSGLLAESNPEAYVYALNDNTYQLDRTPSSCLPVYADMHEIPVEDGAFDVVICSYTMGFARIQEFLTEIRRVLSDRGVFWVYDMAGKSPIMKRALHYDVYPVDEFERLAGEAGFEVELVPLPETNVESFERLLREEQAEARALIGIALKQVEPVLYKMTRKP